MYPKQGEKVVEAVGGYKHVMALALDPRTENNEGVVRCIASREGSVDTLGYVDRSELHRLYGNIYGKFEIGEQLHLLAEEEIVHTLVES